MAAMIGIEPEPPIGEERREHRGGQQRAMGEIDDVQDAVDQRQPERDQRVDRASHQSVEHRRNEDDWRQHGGLPGAGRRQWRARWPA